jgi:hypothetical protein
MKSEKREIAHKELCERFEVEKKRRKEKQLIINHMNNAPRAGTDLKNAFFDHNPYVHLYDVSILDFLCDCPSEEIENYVNTDDVYNLTNIATAYFFRYHAPKKMNISYEYMVAHMTEYFIKKVLTMCGEGEENEQS